MATEDRMEITISPDEAAGLSEYIEHWWYLKHEELDGWIVAETRSRLDEMAAALDLHEALAGARRGVSIEAPSSLLRSLLREGSEYACEVVGSALSRDHGDGDEENQRRVNHGKGLMALAHREGLYEGVMV